MRAQRFPTRLMVEPTSRCNLFCPLCISGRREIAKKPDLSALAFERIYRQFEDGCEELTFHNFGEPLLNRDLPEMIRFAKSEGCSFSVLSTNAMLLTGDRCRALAESGLDEIYVCVDGFTQKTYEQYRVGGCLDRVLAGIQRLVGIVRESGSHLQIVMQFIVFRHNEHELDRAYKVAADLGVDFLDVKVSGSASRTSRFRRRIGDWSREN